MLRCALPRMIRPCGASRSALLFFACFAVVGCGGTTTPSSQRPDETSNASHKPKGSADFSLTAEELEAEYQKDEQATDKKYKGKTIELSGVVKAVYGDGPDFIGLAAGKKTLGLPCVMIEREPWARVAPGQKVKLRGLWPNYGERPALYDCVIVEAGPNPAIVLTAVKLADEYAADADGVKKKYDGKPVILSGEVVENKKDDKGRIVRLKTTGKVRIELRYAPAFEKRGAKMKAGQTVKVFAKLTEYDFTEDRISLTNPYPITK